MRFSDLFKVNPIIAVISQTESTNADTFKKTVRESEIFMSKGVNALMIEADKAHVGDAEKALEWLSRELPGWRYGVHIIGDLAQSCALAEKHGAKLVQADCVCGDFSPEDEMLLEKAASSCSERGAFLLGEIDATDKATLITAMKRCSAFVINGTRLGTSTDILKSIKGIIKEFPLIVNGGIAPETLNERFVIVDGAIINSGFRKKTESDEIDLMVLEDYMSRMKSLRSALFILRRMS